jgi:hypothetical protein
MYSALLAVIRHLSKVTTGTIELGQGDTMRVDRVGLARRG